MTNNSLQKMGGVIAFLVSLLALSNPAAALNYSIDDGVSETSIGLSGGVNLDILWLNSFTIQAGGETIDSISLTWGTPAGGPNNIANGTPTQVILYSDPNNDGDPSDAVVATTAITSVANVDTDTFTTVSITPTTFALGDNFFVAALMRDLVTSSPSIPASFDQSVPLANRSWLYVNTTANTLNINNLSGSLVAGTIESFGFNGNWLLRANAAVPVPFEFSPALGLGVLGSAWLVRKALKEKSEKV